MKGSKERLISAGFDTQSKEKVCAIVDTFKRFIGENKDELTALHSNSRHSTRRAGHLKHIRYLGQN